MSRKLSVLEQKIHQTALGTSNNVISAKDLEVVAPDAVPRAAAINFLMSAGMLKLLKDEKGRLSWRAVVKKELEAKKDMSGEETMVLGHIQASGTEGIWTKHIKAKTELHQTVLDRCLKSLTQKSLIKVVKSVKHPTRKIYMLAHLDPSVELTGGPWYTENELDTEFIRLLSSACLRFIQDRTLPRTKPDEPRALYAISAAPAAPSARDVQTFLAKSKITETPLGVDHVEALLEVLVLDGEVERVPAFGASMWASSTTDDVDQEEDDARAEKKRKRKSEREGKKKKRRRDRSPMDVESESDDDSHSKKKKSRSRHRSRDEDDASDREDRKKKKRKLSKSADNSDDEDDDRSSKSRKSRSRSKGKKSRRHRSPSSSSGSDSDSDSSSSSSSTLSSDAPSRSRSRSKLASAPVVQSMDMSGFEGGAHVYRALPSRKTGSSVGGLAWAGQAPCAQCPVFTFCADDGPVNPSGCVYYEGWLERRAVQNE